MLGPDAAGAWATGTAGEANAGVGAAADGWRSTFMSTFWPAWQ